MTQAVGIFVGVGSPNGAPEMSRFPSFMSRSRFAASLCVVVLAACTTQHPIPQEPSAEASGKRRITTKQGFGNLVAGRTFTNELGSGMCLGDGTMTGEFDGRKLTGYWYWEDQFFCRDIRLGDRHLDSDCQIVFISGDELTVIRKRGKGETETYRLQPPGS